MKKKLPITGKATVVNLEESITDLVQTGVVRPYDRFVPLNDYKPLSATKISSHSVDLVTCFTGLHHIPPKRLDGFICSINRILRTGGSLLLVDHDIKDNQTSDFSSMAHSVYNAAMGVSVKEEKNEIRNFKSLKEWAIFCKNMVLPSLWIRTNL